MTRWLRRLGISASISAFRPIVRNGDECLHDKIDTLALDQTSAVDGAMPVGMESELRPRLVPSLFGQAANRLVVGFIRAQVDVVCVKAVPDL